MAAGSVEEGGAEFLLKLSVKPKARSAVSPRVQMPPTWGDDRAPSCRYNKDF